MADQRTVRAVYLGKWRPSQHSVCKRLAWNVVGCLNPGGSGCGLSAIAGVPNANAKAQIAGTRIHLAGDMMLVLDVAARAMRALDDWSRHPPGAFMA
ncbi:MAG TPA: hypothetical protein VIY51_27715 [Xanthobacteraceae bacterium]